MMVILLKGKIELKYVNIFEKKCKSKIRGLNTINYILIVISSNKSF